MRFLLGSILFFASVVTFGNDSSKGRDYLIQKLERYHKTLPENHFSKKAITLRLAHILSLRAEDNMAQKWSKGCKPCFKKGSKDAQRSIALYRKLDSHMKKRQPSLHALSLFERAYLYRLLGNKEQSVVYLKKVISLKSNPKLVIRAYFNLGEIYFNSQRYQSALSYFDLVLKTKNQWSFRASYKKIWSLYILSNYKSAIRNLESFLKSDFYQSKTQNAFNQELKDKIQTELIILYSKAHLTKQSLNFLYNFKKEDSTKNTLAEKNQRLFELGVSLSRIGRSVESNQVWKMYLSKESSYLKQLEALVYIVDNDSSYGQEGFFKRSEGSLNKIFDLIVKIGSCQESICKVVQRRLEQYLLSNSDRGSKKLRMLFFAKYNSVYPSQFNMLFYEARLAKDFKQYQKAQDLFQKSVTVFSIDSKLPKKDKDNLRRDKEKASALQIEMAEASKDRKRREKSYTFYLQHGSDLDLLFKARYQRVYLIYENKNYKQSAAEFKSLALRDDIKTQKSQALKLKAAHLALTSLSFTRNDQSIKEWSRVFAQAFPKNNKEFIKMNNTAVFNVVKNIVSKKTFSSYPVIPSSNQSFIKAWNTLHQLDLKQTTKKEKVYFYMNKLLLAKELLKTQEVKKSIDQLRFYKLDKKDQKLVLESQLWLAETQFDFKNMLKFAKKLKPKDDSKKHLIYLAYVSELAGENNLSLYQRIIEKYPRSKEAFSLAVRIVELKSQKQKPSSLNKYKEQLIRKPKVFSYLILKADQGRLNESFISSFLKDETMKFSELAQFVKRKQFIESFKKENKPLQNFSIPKKVSQKNLTKAIKRYKFLLQDLEKRADQAIQLQDWTSQVVAFSMVRNELIRFYESVLNLPLPKNLTDQEREQYIKLLKEQIASYKLRAEQLDTKLAELWSNDYLKDYHATYSKGAVFRKPIQWEVEQLQGIAPQRKKKKLNLIVSQKLLKSPLRKVSKEQVKRAYTELKSKPFDDSAIKSLIKLEAQRNNEVMVFYLENRLKKIGEMKGKGMQL